MKSKVNLVTGYKGKLGRLLVERPNFVPIDCDITSLYSIQVAKGEIEKDFDIDVIVNCAAISSIDECEKNYQRAIDVNVHGLANLHKVFGERVLNIGTDQIFSGRWSPFSHIESSKPDPINSYGFSKLGAESVSEAFGGKTIRLSRTVSLKDRDIENYLSTLNLGRIIEVPDFLHRNYLHREFAVQGIQYFVDNYDKMPSVVNYGGLNNISFYDFMSKLVENIMRGTLLRVHSRRTDLGGSPRPHYAGFSVDLAKKLGFPMRNIVDTVSKLGEDFQMELYGK